MNLDESYEVVEETVTVEKVTTHTVEKNTTVDIDVIVEVKDAVETPHRVIEPYDLNRLGPVPESIETNTTVVTTEVVENKRERPFRADIIVEYETEELVEIVITKTIVIEIMKAIDINKEIEMSLKGGYDISKYYRKGKGKNEVDEEITIVEETTVTKTTQKAIDTTTNQKTTVIEQITTGKNNTITEKSKSNNGEDQKLKGKQESFRIESERKNNDDVGSIKSKKSTNSRIIINDIDQNLFSNRTLGTSSSSNDTKAVSRSGFSNTIVVTSLVAAMIVFVSIGGFSISTNIEVPGGSGPILYSPAGTQTENSGTGISETGNKAVLDPANMNQAKSEDDNQKVTEQQSNNTEENKVESNVAGDIAKIESTPLAQDTGIDINKTEEAGNQSNIQTQDKSSDNLNAGDIKESDADTSLDNNDIINMKSMSFRSEDENSNTDNSDNLKSINTPNNTDNQDIKVENSTETNPNTDITEPQGISDTSNDHESPNDVPDQSSINDNKQILSSVQIDNYDNLGQFDAMNNTQGIGNETTTADNLKNENQDNAYNTTSDALNTSSLTDSNNDSVGKDVTDTDGKDESQQSFVPNFRKSDNSYSTPQKTENDGKDNNEIVNGESGESKTGDIKDTSTNDLLNIAEVDDLAYPIDSTNDSKIDNSSVIHAEDINNGSLIDSSNLSNQSGINHEPLSDVNTHNQYQEINIDDDMKKSLDTQNSFLNNNSFIDDNNPNDNTENNETSFGNDSTSSTFDKNQNGQDMLTPTDNSNKYDNVLNEAQTTDQEQNQTPLDQALDQDKNNTETDQQQSINLEDTTISNQETNAKYDGISALIRNSNNVSGYQNSQPKHEGLVNQDNSFDNNFLVYYKPDQLFDGKLDTSHLLPLSHNSNKGPENSNKENEQGSDSESIEEEVKPPVVEEIPKPEVNVNDEASSSDEDGNLDSIEKDGQPVIKPQDQKDTPEMINNLDQNSVQPEIVETETINSTNPTFNPDDKDNTHEHNPDNRNETPLVDDVEKTDNLNEHLLNEDYSDSDEDIQKNDIQPTNITNNNQKTDQRNRNPPKDLNSKTPFTSRIVSNVIKNPLDEDSSAIQPDDTTSGFDDGSLSDLESKVKSVIDSTDQVDKSVRESVENPLNKPNDTSIVNNMPFVKPVNVRDPNTSLINGVKDGSNPVEEVLNTQEINNPKFHNTNQHVILTPVQLILVGKTPNPSETSPMHVNNILNTSDSVPSDPNKKQHVQVNNTFINPQINITKPNNQPQTHIHHIIHEHHVIAPHKVMVPQNVITPQHVYVNPLQNITTIQPHNVGTFNTVIRKHKNVKTQRQSSYHVFDHKQEHYSGDADLDKRYSNLFASFAPKTNAVNKDILVHANIKPIKYVFTAAPHHSTNLNHIIKSSQKSVYNFNYDFNNKSTVVNKSNPKIIVAHATPLTTQGVHVTPLTIQGVHMRPLLTQGVQVIPHLATVGVPKTHSITVNNNTINNTYYDKNTSLLHGQTASLFIAHPVGSNVAVPILKNAQVIRTANAINPNTTVNLSIGLQKSTPINNISGSNVVNPNTANDEPTATLSSFINGKEIMAKSLNGKLPIESSTNTKKSFTKEKSNDLETGKIETKTTIKGLNLTANSNDTVGMIYQPKGDKSDNTKAKYYKVHESEGRHIDNGTISTFTNSNMHHTNTQYDNEELNRDKSTIDKSDKELVNQSTGQVMNITTRGGTKEHLDYNQTALNQHNTATKKFKGQSDDLHLEGERNSSHQLNYDQEKLSQKKADLYTMLQVDKNSSNGVQSNSEQTYAYDKKKLEATKKDSFMEINKNDERVHKNAISTEKSLNIENNKKTYQSIETQVSNLQTPNLVSDKNKQKYAILVNKPTGSHQMVKEISNHSIAHPDGSVNAEKVESNMVFVQGDKLHRIDAKKSHIVTKQGNLTHSTNLQSTSTVTENNSGKQHVVEHEEVHQIHRSLI